MGLRNAESSAAEPLDDMKATWRPRQKTRYLCFNLRRADAEPVGGIGPDAGPRRSHSGRESGEINFAQSFHASYGFKFSG